MIVVFLDVALQSMHIYEMFNQSDHLMQSVIYIRHF